MRPSDGQARQRSRVGGPHRLTVTPSATSAGPPPGRALPRPSTAARPDRPRDELAVDRCRRSSVTPRPRRADLGGVARRHRMATADHVGVMTGPVVRARRTERDVERLRCGAPGRVTTPTIVVDDRLRDESPPQARPRARRCRASDDRGPRRRTAVLLRRRHDRRLARPIAGHLRLGTDLAVGIDFDLCRPLRQTWPMHPVRRR